MTQTVLVARPGRGDTALLLARRRAGGMDVLANPSVDLPSLTRAGNPNRAMGTVLRGLIEALPAPRPASLFLVLAAGSTPLKRAEASLPIPRQVEPSLVADALKRARAAFADDGRSAVLACRPTRYAVDGVWSEDSEAVIGTRGTELTVEATALTAPVALLSAAEQAVRAAGVTLDGVIPPAQALVAACLPEGDGTALHVGYGATLVVTAAAGTVTHQASVPLGRRHIEQDVGEALVAEPDAARELTAQALVGGEGPARPVVAARLTEIETLLGEAMRPAGLTGPADVVSGVPLGALGPGLVRPDAAPCEAADPLLTGAARLCLGLGGEPDLPSLPRAARRRSVLGWLRERF